MKARTPESLPGKAVQRGSAEEGARRSPGQQAFNALIGAIRQRRERLATWEAAIPPFRKKYIGQLLPLVEAAAAIRRRLVESLDQASYDRNLSQRERRLIGSLIVELAGMLLAERDDTALKGIYNAHSGTDYDTQQVSAARGMKSLLEDSLGIELGDDATLSSPDALFARAHAELSEHRARVEAQAAARAARASKRRKSPGQLAIEAQRQMDAQRVTQSIREIYRKLVSALHPDRETDADARRQKTALMQRVNQAYENNNLLQLLELQLELEHIDQGALNNISEDRLPHYNTILRQQVVELDQEIGRVEDEFRMQFGLPVSTAVAPGKIMRILAADIGGLQRTIDDLQADLRAIRDAAGIKAWLKSFRSRHRADPGDLQF